MDLFETRTLPMDPMSYGNDELGSKCMKLGMDGALCSKLQGAGHFYNHLLQPEYSCWKINHLHDARSETCLGIFILLCTFYLSYETPSSVSNWILIADYLFGCLDSWARRETRPSSLWLHINYSLVSLIIILSWLVEGRIHNYFTQIICLINIIT